MKCHKPNTDQEVEFTVYANGEALGEFALSAANKSDDPSTLECFIPVKEGDHLTILGSFTGSVLYGAFDLLADGSFLADKRIDGTKGSTEAKHYKNRKIDFKKVFDAPGGADKIVEGELRVKSLASHTGDIEPADKPGIGSLAVIVSLSQVPDNKYQHDYSSISCSASHWADDGGIPQTHQLEVEVTKDNVTKALQTRHKGHWDGMRHGARPWVKIVFYYRSKDAIEQAGCEKASSDSRALESSDAGAFRSAPTESKTSGKKGKKGIVKADDGDEITISSSLSREHSMFVSPAPTISSLPTSVGEMTPQKTAISKALSPSAEAHDSTPPPAPKKKLFGQKLELPNRITTSLPFTTHRAASVEEEVILVDKEPPVQPPFNLFNKTDQKRPTHGFSELEGLRDSPYAMLSDEEILNGIAEAEAFLGSDGASSSADVEPAPSSSASAVNIPHGLRHTPVKQEVPTSSATSDTLQTISHKIQELDGDEEVSHKNPHAGKPYHIPDNHPNAHEDVTLSIEHSTSTEDETMTSPSPSQTATDLQTDQLTLDEIRKAIPPCGIKVQDLVGELDGGELPPGALLKLVKQVAYSKDGKYFVKPPAYQDSQRSSASPQKLTQPLSQRPTEFKAPASGELEKPTSPNHKQVKVEDNPSDSPSKKRPASSMTTSRESTPSKRPRIEELNARKAQLIKDLAEKKARKAAEQKALEEKRRLRIEEEAKMEEALSREIEMLRQRASKEDEETEALRREGQEEENLAKEAREGRELVEAAMRAAEEA